jgi:hypothetical protein
VIIIKRLCFPTLKEHLADEIERVRAVAKAAVDRVKIPLWFVRDRLYRRVVIASVIKHEVTNLARVYFELLQIVSTTSAILSPVWAPVS